jgi:hypothetical protein
MRTRIALAVLGLACLFGAAATYVSGLSADQEVAGRYYIRNRTQQFYQRARPKVHVRLADADAVPGPTVAEADASGELLAGRYYIRNRTSNFFRRAAPKYHRLIG